MSVIWFVISMINIFVNYPFRSISLITSTNTPTLSKERALYMLALYPPTER